MYRRIGQAGEERPPEASKTHSMDRSEGPPTGLWAFDGDLAIGWVCE
jgi:hypothetical protein